MAVSEPKPAGPLFTGVVLLKPPMRRPMDAACARIYSLVPQKSCAPAWTTTQLVWAGWDLRLNMRCSVSKVEPGQVAVCLSGGRGRSHDRILACSRGMGVDGHYLRLGRHRLRDDGPVQHPS